MHKTVTVTRFNCREFRRVRWAGGEVRAMGARAVIVVFAVQEHKNASVFTGTFMSRREV